MPVVGNLIAKFTADTSDMDRAIAVLVEETPRIVAELTEGYGTMEGSLRRYAAAQKQRAIEAQAAATTEVKLTREQESARRQALAEQLSMIRQLRFAGSISRQEEIAEYRKVLADQRLTAAERRRITEQLAQVEGQAAQEAAAAKIAAEEAVEAKRKEALADYLSGLRQLASEDKATRQEQVEALDFLLRSEQLTTNERRQIEEQVASLRGQIARQAAADQVRAERDAAEQHEAIIRETLAEQLAAIREGRAAERLGVQEAIDGYKKILAQAHLTADERRKISLELAREEGKQARGQAPGVTTTAGDLAQVAQAAGDIFLKPIQQAAEYETALAQLGVISGKSGDELRSVGEAAVKLGDDVGVAVRPVEALRIQAGVMSSGFEGVAESAEVARNAIKLTADGVTTSKEATDVLTSSLLAYGAGADQAGHYTDVLFRSAQVGKIEVSQLAGSLGQVVSFASTAGVSFEELNAVVQAASLNGQTYGSAMAGTRGILEALVKPTKQAKDTMAELGLEVNSQTLRQDGLVKTLERVRVATENNDEAFLKIIGSQEAAATALALVKDGGERVEAVLAEMGNAAGAAADATSRRAATYEQAQKRAQAASEQFAISVGNQVLPALTKLVDTGGAVVQFADKIPGPIKAAALAAAGFTFALTGAASAVLLYRSLGVQIVGVMGELAVKGFGLASGAAKILTAEITLSGTKAAFTSGIFATKTAVMNGYTAALGRARLASQTMAVATAGISGAMLGVVAVLAVVAYAASEWIKIMEETERAEAALLEVEERRAKGLRENKDLIGKNTQELRAMGKTAKDVAGILVGLNDQWQKANEAGDTARAAKIKAQIADVRKTMGELSALENQAKSQQKSAGEAAPKTGGAKAAEAERKEKLAAALAGIKDEAAVGELSKQEQIKRLQDLLADFKSHGQLKTAEARRVESQIARLQGEVRKEAAKDAEASRKEQVADAIAAIKQQSDAGAITKQQERDRLAAILADFKAHGQLKTAEARKLEGDIATLEGQIRRESAEKRKQDEAKELADRKEHNARMLEATKERLNAEEAALDAQLSIVKDSRDEDRLARIKDLLDRKLAYQIQEIRAEQKADLESAKSADERAAVISAAEAKIRAERAKSTAAYQDEIEKQRKIEAEQVKKDADEIARQRKATATAQEANLKTQISVFTEQIGKTDILPSIRRVYAELEAIKEAEIRAEANAVIQATKNEEVKAAAAQTAEAQIQAARAETAKQIADLQQKESDALKKGTRDHKAALDERKQNENSSLVGGKNSPIYSDPSQGLGISLGNFSLGDFSLDSKRKLQLAPTPVVADKSAGALVAALDKNTAAITGDSKDRSQMRPVLVEEKPRKQYVLVEEPKRPTAVLTKDPMEQATIDRSFVSDAVSKIDARLAGVEKAIKEMELAINVQAVVGGEPQGSQAFRGTAQELARARNTFDPNHRLVGQ